jgi:hypothetical protein
MKIEFEEEVKSQNYSYSRDLLQDVSILKEDLDREADSRMRSQFIKCVELSEMLPLEMFAEINKDLREGKWKINISATALVFNIIHKMCDIIQQNMDTFEKTKDRSALKKFIVYASKFNVCTEMIYAAFVADPDDIFYKPIDHPDWELLLSNYSCYEPKDPKKFMDEYNNVIDFMMFAGAYMSWGIDDNKFKSFFKRMSWGVFYSLFKEKWREQFNMFMSDLDFKLALDVYNLPDSNFMASLTKIVLPKIRVNQIIFVPMMEEILTLEGMD